MTRYPEEGTIIHTEYGNRNSPDGKDRQIQSAGGRKRKEIEFVSKKLANGKRIQELQLLKRMLTYVKGTAQIGLFSGLSDDRTWI